MSDPVPSVPPVKPGIATTEFWLAMAVALMGGLAVAFVDSPWAKVAGVVSAALSSLGYGYQRTALKAVSS